MSKIIGRALFGLALISIPAIVVAATTLPPPVTTTGSSTSYLFRALNMGTGPALIGNSSGGYGVYAITGSASTAALRATNTASTAGIAIAATSTGNTINADSTNGNGVVASTKFNSSNSSNFAAGVRGLDLSTRNGLSYNAGVRGSSTWGYGVDGVSVHGTGVHALLNNPNPAVNPGIAAVSGDDETCVSAGGPLPQDCAPDNVAGVLGVSLAGYGVVGGGLVPINCRCDPVSSLHVGVEGSGPYGVVAVTTGAAQTPDAPGAALYVASAPGNPNDALIVGGATGLNIPSSQLDNSGNYALNGTLLAGTDMLVGPVNGGLAADLYGKTSPAGTALVRAHGPTCSSTGTDDVFEFDNSGNLILCGGLTQFGKPMSIVRGTTGAQMVAYSPQQAEPTIEDVGGGEIVNGVGYVTIDPSFASTMDPRLAYRVFITPNGDSRGLYVAQKTASGFVIKESQGGHSTLAFDYRIVAKPWDSNAPRLPMARSMRQIASFYVPKSSGVLNRILSRRISRSPKPFVIPKH